MLIFDGERHKTVRTSKELEEILGKDVVRLSEGEKECLAEIMRELDEKGESKLLEIGEKEQYEEGIVPMKKWMEDDYYFGRPCEGLWDCVREDLIEMFTGDYNEAILSGAIGIGKCLKKDTEIYDIGEGKRVRIDECNGKLVQSFNDGMSNVSMSNGKCILSGNKNVIEITLRSGKKIVCTPDHPLLTINGWDKAISLFGKFIATPRKIPRPAKELEISDDEVKFVAYMLAEGGCTGSGFCFTNFDKAIVDEFIEVSTRLGRENESKFHKWIKPGVFRSKKEGVCYPRCCRWIKKKYKELCVLAKVKRVPSDFYGLSDRQLGLFFNRVFACDGWVGTSPYSMSITLASEKFIDDIQFLLLRFGIHSSKAFSPKKIKDKVYDAWTVSVLGSDVEMFLERVGMILSKEDRCENALKKCRSVRHNTNVDVVPVGYNEMKMIRKDVGGISKKEWNKIRIPKSQKYGRDGFVKLCDKFNLREKWRWITRDIFWDKVVRIRPVGKEDVYDIEIPRDHCFVANGIIVHNSCTAEIAICRQIYEMLCLRNPQRTYGLRSGSTISIMNISVSEKLAQKVLFDAISENINASPWFQKYFKPERTKVELRFPKNIWVTTGSSSATSALGLSVITALLDEQNFLGDLSKEQKASHARWGHLDNAQLLYSSMKRRIKSRFEKFGRLPGILMLVSSKRTTTDFTERRILQAGDERHVFVSERSLWEAKKNDYKDSKMFRLIIGNENIGSKIVKSEADMVEAKEKECRIIEVPVDFREDFDKDLDGAVRDIAGIATMSVYPFMRRREKIESAIDDTIESPYPSDVWIFGEPLEIKWDKLIKKLESGALSPIVNPESIRHIHIDPSLSQDCTGFCMGHIERYTQVRRKDELHDIVIETVPVIRIDFILKIVPPPGDEIVISELRSLVYTFKEKGFNIGFVSMDSYIKADPIQILNSKGFRAGHVSMDSSVVPYQVLKECIYEDRLRMYRYEPVVEELKRLEFNLKKKKVDHPLDGGKDSADSVCGVVYTLTNKQTISIPMSIGGMTSDDDVVRKKIKDISNASGKNVDAVDMFLSDDDDMRDMAESSLRRS